jgi:hypothetical protein
MMVATMQDTMLQSLDRAVTEIADFLVEVDDSFYDGYQTAREVLSHLVFWHREYVVITNAMVNGRSHRLRQSTFVALNARATREFRSMSMASLCQDLLNLQSAFAGNLRRLPDWDVMFPIKKGCRLVSVTERVQLIQEHIEAHLSRLENAQRHGEAWVAAYYPMKNHAQN